MRKYFNEWKFVIFVLSASIFVSTARAQLLDDNFDLDCLKGSKLGFYTGFFDPIHLGHQSVIGQALELGYVDYVLIYPNAESAGCSLDQRLALISCVYQNHPKVLLTSWTPVELQAKLAHFTRDLEIIRIVEWKDASKQLVDAKESANGERGSLSIDSFLEFNISSYVIALLCNEDPLPLQGPVLDLSISGFIRSTAFSSDEIQKAIQEGAPFEQYLSFYVHGVIKQEGLYGYPSKMNHSLKEQLIEMEEKDQYLRLVSIDRELTEEEQKTWQMAGEENGVKIKDILKKYGWPGVSLVGLQGNNAMWLLVQHQDENIELQKQCLELLKDSVARYESSCADYAYLLDRVNKNEGKPQVYGTQWINNPKGKIELYTVEDPENLDKRRKMVGLSSMAEYKELIIQFYENFEG